MAVDQSLRPQETQRRPSGRDRLFRVLRIAGWASIVVGLLILGFVVQQLFVTTWVAQRNQLTLTDRVEERFATAEITEVAFVPAPATPTLAPTTLAPTTPTPAPVTEREDPFEPGEATPSEGPVPPAAVLDGSGGVIAPPGEAADPDPAATQTPTEEGVPTLFVEPEAPETEPIAIITIPSIERLEEGWTVVEGVGTSDLKNGAGHMPQTPMPGQPGNTVISGHRTTYGAPFHELDELEPGDAIEVETAIGTSVYEVHESIVVGPSETWVTAPREGAWLTLTTCNPKFSSRQRLVLFAELVSGPNFEAIYA